MIEELLKYTCTNLDKTGIEYMLSGSIVMSAYTVPRFTRDIDIVINLKDEDTETFLNIFSHNYYFNPITIKNEIKRKGMFNIIDQKTGYKIDFIIKKENEYRNTEFERKKRIKLFDFEVWAVSIEDLIISKLIWIQNYPSEIQKTDIKTLLSLNIDKQYISDWIRKLNLNTFNLI